MRDKLETFPGVKEAVLTESEVKGEEEQFHKARLIVKPNDRLTEEIFRLAVDNGWTLAELRRETASLEDVFRQLTAESK